MSHSVTARFWFSLSALHILFSATRCIIHGAHAHSRYLAYHVSKCRVYLTRSPVGGTYTLHRGQMERRGVHPQCSTRVSLPGLARFSHPGKYRAVITGNYRPGKNLK